VTWIGIDELQSGRAWQGRLCARADCEACAHRRLRRRQRRHRQRRPRVGCQGGGSERRLQQQRWRPRRQRWRSAKQEVRARIAAKERRVEQLYYYRIRLQNVMNRNGGD
jgi:hypothetical protein